MGGSEGEVNGRDVGGGNAHGETGELALHLGVYKRNSLGRTGGGGNHVQSSSTGATQVAVAVVQDPLVAGVAVNGGHQTPVEAEVLIQNLDDRCQAVGGAAGVAEDVPVFVAVLVVVDAHNEGADAITLTRGGEDHLLGSE